MYNSDMILHTFATDHVCVGVSIAVGAAIVSFIGGRVDVDY